MTYKTMSEFKQFLIKLRTLIDETLAEPRPEKILIKQDAIHKKNGQSPESFAVMSAKIKAASEKALLLEFQNRVEAWIPLSTIHNQFAPDMTQIFQEFFIDKWVLKNKGVIPGA